MPTKIILTLKDKQHKNYIQNTTSCNTECTMLKQYNFRIDPKDIKQIDNLEGSRSFHIRNAIQTYIKNNNNNPSDNIYNVDTIQILKEQIQDLKNDKEKLYNQITFLSTPWYMRILLPKQTKNKRDRS